MLITRTARPPAVPGPAVPGQRHTRASLSGALCRLQIAAVIRNPCGAWLCRGRGQVVAAAVASEQVILGTSRGYLLRYYWDESGNEKGAPSSARKAAQHRAACARTLQRHAARRSAR